MIEVDPIQPGHSPEDFDQALHTLAEVSVSAATDPENLEELREHANQTLSAEGSRFKLVATDETETPTDTESAMTLDDELTEEAKALRREAIRSFYQLPAAERRRIRIKQRIANLRRSGNRSDDTPAV